MEVQRKGCQEALSTTPGSSTLCGLEAQGEARAPVQALRKALREEWRGSGCSHREQQTPEVTQEASGRAAGGVGGMETGTAASGRGHGTRHRWEFRLLSPPRYQGAEGKE